ncbi:MAG TPA: sugar ABC transporter permease, partial [Actinomycetota bacterium]|nr:sugar ABC transporter permease [Actinomycetota bacterium]
TTIALYIFNANGLFNHIIGSRTPWFQSASTVIWAIVGLNSWTSAGTAMLYYLAALQSIPTDVYEAAAVDNTGAWRTFWKITFPLLRPANFFILVVFGIGALKLFDQAFIVGGGSGGPNNSTQTPVLYIYREAFSNFDFGVAAAAGVIYFVIIFGLTVVQRLTIGRQDAY